ncbi:MAG TPA: hypothetical protein VMB48_16105 [Steroidobacteraceae bacterium]|nr:hypothetical protein [Steroidobacteraceae bacterium]
MRTVAWLVAAAAGVMCVAAESRASTTEPSRAVLTRAVTQYLAEHGDLCVGKFTWPRVVTAQDRQAPSDDAVQLPVLQHLGLVRSVAIPAVPAPGAQPSAPPSPQPGSAGPARRYSLTAAGRRYYLQKKHTTMGIHGGAVEHDADFCVGHLSLDKVVKWIPPEQVRGGPLETLVSYTYHIQAADWMADPEARRVFPVVDRIIRGQGALLMTATVQLREGRWVPVLPSQ